MIEELTPVVLRNSLFLIIIAAPVLTLVLSTLLMWLYRRAVTREMVAAQGFGRSDTETESAASPPAVSQVGDPGARRRGNALYQRAIQTPWRNATQYAVAVFAAALIFSVAAQYVFPYGLGVPGYFVGVWIYVWPVVVALPLIVPGSARLWVACIVGYVAVYALLGWWASTILNIPGVSIGEFNIPRRSSVTPSNMIGFWLAVNAVPTLLIVLSFNRWVRAVAPIVLALVTIFISGAWFSMMAMTSPVGQEAVLELATIVDMHGAWIDWSIFALCLAIFVATGWTLARWIARGYRRKRLSDRSLVLDALWLVFACMYSMWLVQGGVVLLAAAPAAFLVYKIALAAGSRLARPVPDELRGLTFLRVFSLGRRSEALLDALTKYWRQIGSVQMITGPDVAGSTVQPHQFLDFLSGRLGRHFVSDRSSLDRAIAMGDRKPDPDGRFRINNLFCHADSWQPALPKLVQRGDIVLMDLRSFSSANAGCVHELRFLVNEVPFERCLLVVDDTTDRSFLDAKLCETWRQLTPDSPNFGRPLRDVPIHRFEPGATAVRGLLWRLCDGSPGDGRGCAVLSPPAAQ